MRRLLLFAISCSAAFAQDVETFRVEIQGSAWLTEATGNVQSGPFPVDFANDLGLKGRHPQFTGRLTLKPGRRHRILLEGAPYRFDAENDINREITFGGRVYRVQDHVTSRAELNYFFGGYQFDVVSTPRGHLGFHVGGAWFQASAQLHSTTLNADAIESHTVGLPLAGVGFRYGRRVGVSGSVKGMTLGDLGHYVDGRGQLDVHLGRHVTLQAGYAVLDAEVRRRSGNIGMSVRFEGPLFSVALRY